MEEMPENKKDKICFVCGDKALGYNFNAITCESCKAFFRRNALKNKEFKCHFSNNCVVDVLTRRFCQKCRLHKCFSIGMKKEWIMSEEEKQAKRAKVEINRLKKKQELCNKHNLISHRMAMPLEAISLPLFPFNTIKSKPPKLNPKVYRGSTTRKLALNPSHITPYGLLKNPLENLVSAVPIINNISETLSSKEFIQRQSTDVLKDFECYDSKVQPIEANNYLVHQLLMDNDESTLLNLPSCSSYQAPILESPYILTQEERATLDELHIANEFMKQPLSCGFQDPSLTDVLNMTDHAIRRLIKMSKRLRNFRNLCQEDQIALLKGGCCELMILRSVMSYDPEKECWKGPDPKIMTIKMDVLKKAGGTVYDQHKKFIMGFDGKLKGDESIMLLLGAITLFTPERPNIIHKELIKAEQDMYSFLLQRYLHTVLVSEEAVLTFHLLSQKLKQLHSLNKNHVEMFMEVNPKDIEPLLIEIFDLKF